MIQTWLLLTFIFMCFGVSIEMMFRILGQKSKDEVLSTICWQICALFTALLCIPFFSGGFAFEFKVFLLLLISGIFFALSDTLQTIARKRLEVGTASVLFNISTVFLFIFGVVQLKEPLILTKVLGCFIILTSVFVLFFKDFSFKPNKSWVYMLGSGLFYAAGVSLFASDLSYLNLAFYSSITYIVPALILIAYKKFNVNEIIQEFKIQPLTYVISGFVIAMGFIVLISALKIGEVSRITPITATVPLFSVIASYFILKENSDLINKIIAAFLVAIGVYFTVI